VFQQSLFDRVPNKDAQLFQRIERGSRPICEGQKHESVDAIACQPGDAAVTVIDSYRFQARHVAGL
jgi:hypothetical protein